MNFKLLFCLQLPAAPKQCGLNIYRRITVCLSFNPYSLRSNKPRSWSDSWLQKRLKTPQRGHWDLPDHSSGAFSTGCFREPFPASFKRRGTAALAYQGPCFIRHFGTAQLSDTEPQVLGGPHCAPGLGIWIAAGNPTAGPSLLNNRHQGTATTQHQCHRWGTDNVCHFSLTSSTPNHLFWSQQQLFQFNTVSTLVEQKCPPIPYKRTKDT